MQAFHGPAAQQPARTTPTSISVAPPPPSKEEPRRVPKPSRRTSGGLSGQYSTSMPASGGYFPDVDQLEDEAALMRKERQRQREEKRRALKAAWGTDTRMSSFSSVRSRLTTAAEPWEDFGGSPLDENLECECYLPTCSETNQQYPPTEVSMLPSDLLEFLALAPTLLQSGRIPHSLQHSNNLKLNAHTLR